MKNEKSEMKYGKCFDLNPTPKPYTPHFSPVAVLRLAPLQSALRWKGK
jgi:hypothetical protein